MWSNDYSVVRPEEFKRNIGEFAPQFSGRLSLSLQFFGDCNYSHSVFACLNVM